MLETPSIRRYSFIVTPLGDDVAVSSDKPSGAVNQQERPGAEEWAVGFVDGEGCFSISVVRNTTCRSGWQVQHEFAVTQAASSRSALENLIEGFGCGGGVENPRWDENREALLRFSVKRRADLVAQVVPFLEVHPLRTAKQLDFEKFAAVLRMREAGEDLPGWALRTLCRITES